VLNVNRNDWGIVEWGFGFVLPFFVFGVLGGKFGILIVGSSTPCLPFPYHTVYQSCVQKQGGAKYTPLPGIK
jgi:hypothetical protein